MRQARVNVLDVLGDLERQGRADVVDVRPGLLVRGEAPLVEAPAVLALRTAVVLRDVVCRDGVVERRQHGVPHAVEVARVRTDGLAVVGRQLDDGRLGQLAVAPAAQRDSRLLAG